MKWGARDEAIIEPDTPIESAGVGSVIRSPASLKTRSLAALEAGVARIMRATLLSTGNVDAWWGKI